MNEFLKTKDQILASTKWLKENGFESHPISCKDWEISQIIPYMKDGDWLDMGSDGSVVLPNLLKKGVKGKKYGVDLSYTDNVESPNGYKLIKGDLMNTPFFDDSLDYITSLSVLEHQIDFDLFSKEVSRLLRAGGQLFVSFDFWEPKPETSKTKLYSLDWDILDKQDVVRLIVSMAENRMAMTSVIDWSTKDAVINDKYCSPAQGVSYTFSILSFVKTNL